MVSWLGLGVSMSVVNDILKDLHQRRGQHQYMPNIPLDFEDGDVPKFNIVKRLSLLIMLFIAICALFYFSVLNLPSKQASSFIEQIENITPERQDKGMAIEANEKNIVLSSIDNTMPVESILINEVDKKEIIPSNQISKQKTILELNQNKDLSSSPLNSNTKASIKPNSEKKMPARNQKSVVKTVSNDELLIRKLMVSNPEKVWPHIKKLLPKSNNQTSLIALGAQGEQRSKNHQNAIELYKTLSDIEPNESKWRVGSAISYDALSRYDDALVEYKKSLILNALPAPLYSFVKQRIAQLTGIDNER
jgi:tetratricopeptide (TPR) repeat protein